LSEIILTIDGIDPLALYGEKNSKLNLLKKAYPGLTITSRGSNIKISGEKKDSQKAKRKIEMMVSHLKKNDKLSDQNVIEILNGDNPYENHLPAKNSKNVILYGRNAKPITARTRNQKTAVALAVLALKNRLVKKIILTRPAVEAGESLGFLPGDLKDKIDPYLRPLYDALDDMLPAEKLNQFVENRVIEIAPLAFMRGRTLDNAFVILDEAQNCTSTQLKMFLTRLGPNAKCIITGDLSQIDLPRHQKSGLYTALELLKDLDGIGYIFLTAEDVVRHRLVKEIIKRYDSNRTIGFNKKEEED